MATLESGRPAAEEPGAKGLTRPGAAADKPGPPLGASKACRGLLDRPNVTAGRAGTLGPHGGLPQPDQRDMVGTVV